MSTRTLLQIQLSTLVVYPDRPTTTRVLNYAIRLITPLNSTSSTVEIEVTDDKDSFFLCILRISEAEYAAVKAENSLLVDFTAFPDRLVDRFQMCLHQRAGGISGSGSSLGLASPGSSSPPAAAPHYAYSHPSGAGKFGLELHCRASPQLLLFEENEFKKLVHLTLRISMATDVALKEYLADQLAKYKVLPP